MNKKIIQKCIDVLREALDYPKHSRANINYVIDVLMLEKKKNKIVGEHKKLTMDLRKRAGEKLI